MLSSRVDLLPLGGLSLLPRGLGALLGRQEDKGCLEARIPILRHKDTTKNNHLTWKLWDS